ncbi:helix-turn-helix domain-containing protein [Rhodococcus opacus]|uniref:AlbA family DNA-binding domain-containing protein n=1 Tax=Rhodococcus opacus TaxID=37919 RepID=UPI0006BB4D8C|nr:ATP-binding protein [Rhodococcus opacus]
MNFTALHRLLGREPGLITDAMIDAAVENGIKETDDLDWKSELPPARGLPQMDYPKDIAAMANSGGGTIVYGIEESQKAAIRRLDVGELTETHERALRSAAVTAISPPIFGLGIHVLGDPGNRAVAVVVPASVDGPHLIYRNDYFGAPIRNDADTVWMKERQIEAMYKARFDERRHEAEALTNLYDEAATGRDTDRRAWLIAVAHPRLPAAQTTRPTLDKTKEVFKAAGSHALIYVGRNGIHPLESVDLLNPRPGLRRWIAANIATTEHSRWRESWVSVHHDGAVSLATVVGGHPAAADRYNSGDLIDSSAVECAVADLMGMIRAVSEHRGTNEYEVRIGIEWTGGTPLVIQSADRFGHPFADNSIPLARYSPVLTTVRADADSLDFFQQVHDLAEDCINQGGLTVVRMINPPSREE